MAYFLNVALDSQELGLNRLAPGSFYGVRGGNLNIKFVSNCVEESSTYRGRSGSPKLLYQDLYIIRRLLLVSFRHGLRVIIGCLGPFVMILMAKISAIPAPLVRPALLSVHFPLIGGLQLNAVRIPLSSTHASIAHFRLINPVFNLEWDHLDGLFTISDCLRGSLLLRS